MLHLKKGFTLIELLIVIALLGALAVGLLAALDPFEQLKKGTDTGIRNMASEVHGATVRYYALRSIMPWCTDATCADTQPSGNNLSSGVMSSAITNIIAAGELKSNFTQLAGNNVGKIFVTGDAATSTVKVCFLPTAKSFKCDPNTKYDRYGALDPACGLATTCGSLNTCYWCVQ